MAKSRRPAERTHIPREARHLFDLAIEQGFTVERTSGNHIKWTNPKVRPPNRGCHVSGTTPARSALGNLTADLRRIGLQT